MQTLPRERVFSKSQPRPHHVGEGVRVHGLVDLREEKGIHGVCVDVFEGDGEVWREPAVVAYRKNRRKLALDVLKYGKGLHTAKRVEVFSNHEAVLCQTKLVHGRHSRRVKGNGDCGHHHKRGEEVVAKEYCGNRAGDGDNAERPVPISRLGIVVVFGARPRKEWCASHVRIVAEHR